MDVGEEGFMLLWKQWCENFREPSWAKLSWTMFTTCGCVKPQGIQQSEKPAQDSVNLSWG